jgi:alkylated DNA repair dioxygenase AlkB
MGTQLALLPEITLPAGLRYRADFITPEQEQTLIAHIRALPLSPFQFGTFKGKRRVVSFGSRYDFSRQRLEEAAAIPPWIEPTIAQIETFAALPLGAIRHVLVTEYEAGAGIGWHRDKKHFGLVFGLSLASACKFRFRRKHGASWQRFTLDAERRSLYVMSGESRSVWEHSIPPVETVRYSITFRTLADG